MISIFKYCVFCVIKFRTNFLRHIFAIFFLFFLNGTPFSNSMPSACYRQKTKKKSVYFADRKIALSYDKKNAFRWLLNTAPHSPRRQKLNLRMKSLSLDSPESSELHGNMKRRYPLTGATHFNMQGGSAGLLDHNTPTSNNSRLHCKRRIINLPFSFAFRILNLMFLLLSFSLFSFRAAPLSPSTARRLGYNRNLRTTSVELPDEVEKSLSSASTSPCSSPGRNLAVE